MTVRARRAKTPSADAFWLGAPPTGSRWQLPLCLRLRSFPFREDRSGSRCPTTSRCFAATLASLKAAASALVAMALPGWSAAGRPARIDDDEVWRWLSDGSWRQIYLHRYTRDALPEELAGAPRPSKGTVRLDQQPVDQVVRVPFASNTSDLVVHISEEP